MFKYEVHQTIQAPGNEPVSFIYCRTNELSQAIVAMGQASIIDSTRNYFRINEVKMVVNYDG